MDKRKILMNNKGLTMIELIVVIAVATILVGMATITLSVVNSGNTTKSASQLRSLLTKSKMESMAKGNTRGQIIVNPNGGKGMLITIGPSSEERIAGNSVQTGYAALAAPVENFASLSNTAATTIQFNSAGMVSTVDGAVANYATVYQFGFKKGRRVDSVVFYPATGKVDTLSWYE